MIGNPLLPVLGVMNAGFGGPSPGVADHHAKAFAPGADLGQALTDVLDPGQRDLTGVLAAYVATWPGGIREQVRTIIHYALTSNPRVLLTFAWAPAYDFELTTWEIVEPAPHRSGMTVLLKGRYPDHKERFG